MDYGAVSSDFKADFSMVSLCLYIPTVCNEVQMFGVWYWWLFY